MMQVILASTSQIRHQILTNAGVPCRAVRPRADEEQLKSMFRGHHDDMPGFLARHKAISVSMAEAATLIIGADQILECDGILFSKPASHLDARSQLSQLRGKTHRLVSAVSCCIDGKELWSHQDQATLTMRNFSDSFIETYLERNAHDITTSVGAYKLEKSGIQLFDAVQGNHFTILGLPLLPLLKFLREAGVIPT